MTVFEKALKFRALVPMALHRHILGNLIAGQLGDDAPHERVPDEILADTAVKWVVRSMLGSLAEPDPCRHVHVNSRGEPGDWHVDNYCGQPWPQGLAFAILCYFPQDTSPEMGPTAARLSERVIVADGPAGTCLLMAQDVEHRAMGNTTGRQRYMLKYLFRAPAA